MTRALDSADLLDAALDAAARGWPVFPLHPGTKRPALHGYTTCPRQGACAGGHQGWEQRATTDPARIRAAWAAGPFNIGLATGPAALLVVDCDTPKDPDDPDETPPGEWAGATGGIDVLAVLAERGGAALPATFTVATPSGGRHLYYRAPAGVELRNTAGLLGWKIDTRAHGGYVVAAGSTTPAGTYTVIDDREPAELPAWLLQRLRPAPPPSVPAGPIRAGAGRRGIATSTRHCGLKQHGCTPPHPRSATPASTSPPWHSGSSSPAAPSRSPRPARCCAVRRPGTWRYAPTARVRPSKRSPPACGPGPNDPGRIEDAA